jgi:hypothetical protein
MNKRFWHIVSLELVMIFIIVIFMFSSCASGGPSGSSSSKILRISLKVSDTGSIDTSTQGYYAILFNSLAQNIEVTNYETFTDYIRFDGYNYSWFHRQGNVPSPGYTWVEVGNLNASSTISSDGKTIIVRIDLSDPTNIFNQFIISSTFTSHVITTDRSNSLLGRVIDTMGQGPSLGGNTLYTLKFDKVTGLGTPPPPSYPNDPLGDWDVKPDLPSFPYVNYDIESFRIEFE